MGKPLYHPLRYVANGWVENASTYPSGNKSPLSNLREGGGQTSSSIERLCSLCCGLVQLTYPGLHRKLWGGFGSLQGEVY